MEPTSCDLIDPVDHPPIVISSDGVLRELSNGEIVNSGGTSYTFWTVGGKGLLFDDGTSSSPCSDGSNILSSSTLQSAYNNSTAVNSAATIKLDDDKSLAVLSSADEIFFKINAETGNLVLNGELEVKLPRQFGSATIFKIDENGNLTARFNLDVEGLINGIDIVEHVDGISSRHTAADIDIEPIPDIPGAVNVQQALENLGAVGKMNGMNIPLADAGEFPTDGSWTPGALVIDDTTLVTDAIDGLNALLSRLIPTSPPNLGTINNLFVTSVGNSAVKAAGDAPDNTGGGTIPTFSNTAGNPVTINNVSGRITSPAPNSSVILNVGSGSSGVLAVAVNGSTEGNQLPAFTSDVLPIAQTVGATVMTGRSDYPLSTPGFWKSFNVQAAMSNIEQGWNRVRITHSNSGNSNEFYMLRDNLSVTPTVSATSLTEIGSPTFAYSSGIPHYGDSTAALNVSGLIMSNIAGETYYDGYPLGFSGTNSIVIVQQKPYASVGISTPIARQTLAPVNLTDQTVAINGTNIHNSGYLQVTATNVNGSSAPTNITNSLILVKRGQAGTRIDEMSIPVVGLGTSPNASNAVRRGGFTGTDQPNLNQESAWVSSSNINSYDAAVVGGLLTHCQTDFSMGYYPVGPNLSAGRSTSQYFTCKFQRESRSNFKIVITGTYSKCWVALPGISSLSSSTGWWDMGVAFSGSGYPGDIAGGNGSNGCCEGVLMTGNSGTYICTFGTQSSTFSTDNDIIVRFKLEAGQSITSLRFTN
jgi:hypothetical protein